MAANINRPPTPEAERRELSMEDHVQLKVLCSALMYCSPGQAMTIVAPNTDTKILLLQLVQSGELDRCSGSSADVLTLKGRQCSGRCALQAQGLAIAEANGVRLDGGGEGAYARSVHL